jgi:anti-sigma-K factor RskA
MTIEQRWDAVSVWRFAFHVVSAYCARNVLVLYLECPFSSVGLIAAL